MTPAIKTRSLKLMADYECSPLWEQTETSTDNVDPEDLPISQSLRDALNAWAQRYDDTFDRDDPRRSGFPNPEAEVAFNVDGQALLDRLNAELGQEHTLTFQA